MHIDFSVTYVVLQIGLWDHCTSQQSIMGRKDGIVFQLLLVSCLSLTKVTPLGLNGVFPVVWRSPSGQLVGKPGPIPHRVLHGHPEVLGAEISTSVRGGLGHQSCFGAHVHDRGSARPFLPRALSPREMETAGGLGDKMAPGQGLYMGKQPGLQCGEGPSSSGKAHKLDIQYCTP